MDDKTFIAIKYGSKAYHILKVFNAHTGEKEYEGKHGSVPQVVAFLKAIYPDFFKALTNKEAEEKVQWKNYPSA